MSELNTKIITPKASHAFGMKNRSELPPELSDLESHRRGYSKEIIPMIHKSNFAGKPSARLKHPRNGHLEHM